METIMNRTRILAAAAALLLFAYGSLSADNNQRPLVATLTGAAEVPGPGDPDGSGSATITVSRSTNQVSYSLSVANIDAATAAHIHRGVAGVAGPVVVTLSAPSAGSSNGTVGIDAALAKALFTEPWKYYVNVHNAEYPGGAVRGQLSK
jgi:hypothetical protein